jgi:flagellar hook-associated protein 1 FlgK
VSSLLNVGSGALLANQAALQTIGHNIANVNTPGYSRQTVLLESAGSQYTGGGYIGRGVNIANVVRQHSDFLTRQATLANAVSASDSARSAKVSQIEQIFPGGSTGLGAAVTNMLNSFSDVATAPSDLTARSVVLTQAQELASRFTQASTQLDQLQSGTQEQLQNDLGQVNNLVGRIADMNQQIANATGRNQAPNDLMDKRDTLIDSLNKMVQTTQVAQEDGSTNVFIGSQPVVLGSATSTVSLVADPAGDPSRLRLAVGRTGTSTATVFDENSIGGGEMAGLLRVNNTDIAEARNLVGRMATVTSSEVNAQHKVGIDLDGNPGGNLFKPVTIPDGYRASTNTPTGGVYAGLKAAVSDPTQLSASDYQVSFTSATAGTMTRLSDGKSQGFDTTITPPAAGSATMDGLIFTAPGGPAPVAGDSFTVKPFATAAAQMGTQFSSPRQLAVGDPMVVSAAQDNKGTVTVAGFNVTPDLATPTSNVVIRFNSPTSYTLPPSATILPFQAGAPISVNGWQLTLSGAPAAGDVVLVQPNDNSIGTPLRDPAAWPTTAGATPVSTIGGPIKTTAGNASALANLRDKTTYDGAPLSDGFAGLMSQIGTRVQSAQFTAGVSGSIAQGLQSDAASLSGVNLDEEAGKLLQYQQAYQAAAKMIQIAQSIFTSVIQTVSG